MPECARPRRAPSPRTSCRRRCRRLACAAVLLQLLVATTSHRSLDASIVGGRILWTARYDHGRRSPARPCLPDGQRYAPKRLSVRVPVGAGACRCGCLSVRVPVGAGACRCGCLSVRVPVGAGACRCGCLSVRVPVGAGACRSGQLVGAGACRSGQLVGAGACRSGQLVGAASCRRGSPLDAVDCRRWHLSAPTTIGADKLSAGALSSRAPVNAASDVRWRCLVSAGACFVDGPLPAPRWYLFSAGSRTPKRRVHRRPPRTRRASFPKITRCVGAAARRVALRPPRHRRHCRRPGAPSHLPSPSPLPFPPHPPPRPGLSTDRARVTGCGQSCGLELSSGAPEVRRSPTEAGAVHQTSDEVSRETTGSGRSC